MKVVVVASTSIDDFTIQKSGYALQMNTPLAQSTRPPLYNSDGSVSQYFSDWFESHCISDADELAEMAGRLCYQSFHRPNQKTAENRDYLAHIIEVGHFSILEHASVTFYVEGVSRAMLLELERHRHLSFSVVSQRYVDHSDAQMIEPPIVKEMGVAGRSAIGTHMLRAQDLYVDLVARLQQLGYNRKEARGAARCVLPEGTETKFVVTGNLRAWREIIGKRNSPHADQEIREFAQLVLGHLKNYASNSMQDLEI